MKIISTTNVSREGTDCYIYEELSLVEQFGVYAIISFYKVSDLTDQGELRILYESNDYSKIMKKYCSLGGTI